MELALLGRLVGFDHSEVLREPLQVLEQEVGR